MRKFVLFIFLFVALGLYAGGHTTVIVSLDGFRWDYPQMYDTDASLVPLENVP